MKEFLFFALGVVVSETIAGLIWIEKLKGSDHPLTSDEIKTRVNEL